MPFERALDIDSELDWEMANLFYRNLMQSNHKTIISGAGGVLGKAFLLELLDDGHSIFASEINSQKVDELKYLVKI